MNRGWKVLALVLISAGGACLGTTLLQQHKEDKETARYQVEYGRAVDEFLKLCNQWRQLTPEEQLAFSWGRDELALAGDSEQSAADQAGRLRADREKLITTPTESGIVADTLYGKDWDKEIRRYRAKKEMRTVVATTSIMSILAGVIIYCGCFANRFRSRGDAKTDCQKGTISQAVEKQDRNRCKENTPAANETDDSSLSDPGSENLYADSEHLCTENALNHYGLDALEFKNSLGNKTSN